MVPVVIVLLIIPTVVSHQRKNHRLNFFLGMINSAVLTLFMIWSLTLLVIALPKHTEAPTTMLRSSLALWVSNVLIFALWYWRLDAGGPNGRDLRVGSSQGRVSVRPDD